MMKFINNLTPICFICLGIPLDTHYEIELGQKTAGALSPLIPSSRNMENAAIL